MERIKLSKSEKQVLRLLQFREDCPHDYPEHIFSASVYSLERKGFVAAAWASGHRLIAAHLTDAGYNYLAINPTLRNAMDWKWIMGVIVALLTMFATFLGVLTACIALK